MDRVFRILSILFVVSLFAVPLTGCDSPPWESGMVLVLKVDMPRDNTTVNTSATTVGGRVVGTESATAKVKINDADVPVKDGKFSSSVTLAEGKNIVNIVALSASGFSLTEKVTVTYFPAK